MERKTMKELIKTIRDAVEPHYRFPYYGLVRVRTKRYGTFHVPAPFFSETHERAAFARELHISSERRDDDYFECPLCGSRNFFAGVCETCTNDIAEDYWCGETTLADKDFFRRMEGWQAMKDAAKQEFLNRIDSRLPLSGFFDMEMILPIENLDDGVGIAELYVRGNLWADMALDEIEKRIEGLNIGRPVEDHKVFMSDIECEEITVENSDINEVRRFQNGRWYHKHLGIDFWHPMSRKHQERPEPMRND